MMDNGARFRYKYQLIAPREVPLLAVKRETEARSGCSAFVLGLPLDQDHHSSLVPDLVSI
jgi:hypothetical protein